MDHAFSFVPLVILIASGKGGLPLVTDANFCEPASVPAASPIRMRVFPSPPLAKRRRQPLQSAIYPCFDLTAQ